jgi:hypothetical protein
MARGYSGPSGAGTYSNSLLARGCGDSLTTRENRDASKAHGCSVPPRTQVYGDIWRTCGCTITSRTRENGWNPRTHSFKDTRMHRHLKDVLSGGISRNIDTSFEDTWIHLLLKGTWIQWSFKNTRVDQSRYGKPFVWRQKPGVLRLAVVPNG